jgi:O-antigen ligase
VNLPTNDQGPLLMARWLPFLVLAVALVDVLATDVSPWTALTASLVGALVSAFGALFSFAFLNEPRATGPLEDPNDLAYVLTAAIPIALMRLGVARTWAAVVGGAGALALLMAGTAVTVSRGGAIAFTLTLGWVVFRRLVPARLLVAGGTLIGLAGTGALLAAASQVSYALGQKAFIASTNIETRSLRWQAALRIISDHPLIGVGPGGAPVHYMQYSGFAELAERTPVVHQMYLEVGAELGLIGLFLFLCIILGAFVASEMVVRRRERDGAAPTDPMRLAAYATQGSLLAVCTASMFLSEEYYMPLWIAVATAAALELRTRPSSARRRRSSSAAEPSAAPAPGPATGLARTGR